MNNLRKTSAELIDEALKVAQELVRVAILWEESWHWGLEEASRQYFGDGNVQAMLDILITLHKTLDEVIIYLSLYFKIVLSVSVTRRLCIFSYRVPTLSVKTLSSRRTAAS